jgi:hypothetical protein
MDVKRRCLLRTEQIAPAEAQREILDDWQAAYHRCARVKCARPR